MGYKKHGYDEPRFPRFLDDASAVIVPYVPMFLPGPALLSGAINATWITSCRAARVFGCPAGLGHPKRTFWLLQNEKTHTKQIPMTDPNGAAILMVLH